MTERDTDDDNQHIAVIGMAGRFPGAEDPEEFWRNIADGIESVTWLSDQDLLAAGIPERRFREPGYVRAATVLNGMEQFDAGLFGLTPMEAAVLDPQHRMLLEGTQALFDHAGYNPDTLSATTGVYVGVGFPSYLVNNLLGHPELIEQVGMQRIFFATDKGFAPTRISHKFDLTGPSVGVDTACSTSLVAVHQAARALLGYECDLAVAGGASVNLPSGVGYQYEEGGIHSPDGHCRAFDAGAGGTRFGSGMGLVLLKRLSEAVADGDHVLAVIRGSAVNNDGAAKAGFTAPSATGQAAVIAEALAFADVEPDTVGYVEAHGTGTVIGDPIELAGLTRAFRERTGRRQYCAIGSLKTNVGHLDVAAGIAGLIKTVQALRNRELPPSLHFEQPNPAIDFARSPFYVNTELRPWAAPDEAPRRAGVSSFGIGGTNAHVVLEEAPVRPASGPSRDAQLVVFSARSPRALDRLGAELADAFRAAGDTPLADLAFTLSTGRRAHPHRRAIVCRDRAAAIEALAGERASVPLSGVAGANAPSVAFVFPGQGAQQVRMLAGLFAGEPVFREVVDRCAEHAAEGLGVDLRQVIWPDPADEERERERLDRTWLTQPALFTVTLALARLWMAWGVRPSVLIGHSVGEYVAATLAEVLRFEDALDLVVERARLMNEAPGGAMLAVSLDEQSLLPLLGDCSLAAVNGPQHCVAAGPYPAVEELERRLTAQGVEHRRLRTSHAFHSAMLDPVVGPFEEQAAHFDLRAPRIPMVSCLTGQVASAGELGDPGYWARQLRGTVRFADAVRTAAEQGAEIFLEVGPGRTLGSMVRRSGVPAHRVISSARGAEDPRTDGEALLEALGALHCAGVPVDWQDFWAGQRRHRLPLPGQPFERERHWIEPVPGAAAPSPQAAVPPLTSEPEVKVGSLVRRWTPVPRPAADAAAWQPGDWLVVADDDLGQALADRLEKEGESVVRVRHGAAFSARDTGFVLDPTQPEDVAALLDALRRRGTLPHHIVLECGPVTAGAPGDELRLAGAWVAELLAGAEDHEVQLALVARGLHRIAADDDPSPNAAALTGFCRAVAADHPELAVVCVDVDDRLAEAADGIVGELAGGISETVVALRAGTRYVECYEEDLTTQPASQARSFVLTGGPAEVPMLLARRLARQRRARLTLVERRPLPPEPQWPDWLDEGAGPGLALAAVSGDGTLPELKSLTPELSAAEHQLAQAAGAAWDRDTVGAVLNRLCGSHVYRTLRDSGVDLRAGVVHRRAEIAERMRILPAFTKFLDFFLQVLHEDGVVRCEEDRVEVLRGPEQVELFDSAAANAQLPGFEPTIAFIDHCVRNFPAALSGAVDAVGVLFPDGDSARLEQAFRTLLDASNYRVYAELVGRLLAELADAAPGRPLRVLEVGGGNGQLTRIVAAALRGRDVEYCFTDLGGSFVRRARQWAAGCGFTSVDCQVFDITRDPIEQGLQAHSFDAVIGFDVVHATPRIAHTVENLRGLIAPGGLLGLVEAVVSLRWVELLWGLAEGWWLFEDEEVRSGSPLIPLDTWDRVLRERPFAEVASFPRDEAARNATDYGMVLAQQPASLDSPGHREHLARRAEALLSTTRERIGAVRELTALGAEVMVVDADPTSPEHLARVLSGAAARFGRVDGIVHAPELPLHDPPAPWEPADLPALTAPHVAAARTLVRAAAEAEVPALAFVSPARAVTGGRGGLRPALAGSVFDVFAGDRVAAIRWDADGDPALLEHALGRPGEVLLAGAAPDLGTAADRRERSARRAAGAAQAPAADVEQEILVIFRQLFGTEELGTHDDFYRLGGDSLLATQVIARIRRHFRVDLAVKALFDAPTVAGLAEKVRAAQSEDAHPDIPLLRVARDEPAPLSFGQQSLWLAEQFHGPSATYNIPGAVRLLGRLEIEPLRRALNEVVGRHEVLRTTVRTVDGSPVQRIHQDVTVGLPLRDVAEDEIEALAQEHARTVFDLERGPLIRVALLRVAEADHVLLVNIHHIVSDGWSLGVLVEELVTLYSAFVRGQRSPLVPLDHQYADFADWQRRWLDGELFERQLAYWRRQLAGAPKLLALPTDRPRPETQRIRNAVHRFVVPPELAERLGGLSRDEGATLFMVLLAGFKVLLSRLARTTDVSVGTTNANRTRAVFEQMIGMFVNNLVLRTDLGGDPTFRELLARVRATSVDAYAHQDLPFLTLVDELRQERSPAHTPLFQVLFLLQKLNITLELPGLTARTIEVDALHTKFDLTLFMEEQAQGIVGTFIYNAELFDAATIDLMATRLVRLLHDAVQAPDTRIGELRMENNDEMGTLDMTERNSQSSRLQSLRSAKRRSLDVGRISPVRTGFLPGLPQAPLVLTPAADVDLAGWLRGNREVVDAHLHKHGAVLLRGFHEGSVERFEEAASAICPTLFPEYGDLPREGESTRVYKSTPYPEDRPILFHNESSHLHTWPMRQFFSCIVAAREGGETPIVDGRRVLASLRPELAEEFTRRGLRYVRNFIDAVDVSWSRFYGTEDRAEVERKCAEAGEGFSWLPDGTLRTWRRADAVLPHPRTGEAVFFNQLALHHPSCLDTDTRQSLEVLYGETGLPRNVYWGDGSVIPDEVVTEVREVMDREALVFTWQEGDVLVTDNMLVAHARRPFSGPRKIVVALGDMMRADLPTSADR
ncbi:type I polyketide synthase [Streptomyces sp. AS58]|uniref:type I polyketide synthase n=1 Tax=Streptomyces sp. AS58 TaxID=1519489 RepID=UPI0006B053A9|nr:type I polyketide synthase [Streptomyces sp. AS58]